MYKAQRQATRSSMRNARFHPYFYEHCEICNVNVNSQSQFDQHMKSAKHLRKVAQSSAMWDHLTQDDSIIGYSRTEKMCVACQIIIPDENSKIVQHITSYGHKQKKNLKLENTKQVLSAPGCELCGVNYGGCAKEEYLHLVGKKHNSNLSKKLKSQPKDTTYKTKDTPSSAGIQDTPNKTAQNLDNSTDNAERANKSIDYGVSGLYGLVSDGVITSVDSDAKLSNVLDYGVCDENAVKKADKNEDKTADKKADKKKVHCDDTSINNAQSDALESLDKIGLKEKLRSVQMDLKSLRQKEGKENDVKIEAEKKEKIKEYMKIKHLIEKL